MNRKHVLVTAALGGAVVSCTSVAPARKVPSGTAAVDALPDEGALPSLDGATEWLNSPPLSAAALRGKVVLVDFWTYTCINWRRSAPYVRAWSEKYAAQGLVVIGVHTPEFGFERDVENVRWAVKDMNVAYPVAIDSDRVIWDAFQNQYWPALYIIGADGHIRYHQFGEGAYEESEAVIQQLLGEVGIAGVSHDVVSLHPSGAEVAADWPSLQSGEEYLGYDKAVNFASPGGPIRDQSRPYLVPSRLSLNRWALGGVWTVGSGAALSGQPNGRIAYRFHARDLHLVMGPSVRGTAVPFRVTIDREPPGLAHGVDVDAAGNGTAREQRMYQLIRQTAPIVDHLFEIEFLQPGVEVFSFTFG
jgi:thiol-disulfide isomerase/thioredoxin